ncbi:alr0857 family protein [Nostoc sp. C117]|uniref:alr0857 family protein n=1 Tax=Nostoc sp. C117 TaxID=3349875 RepID=UPI00370D5157
MLKLTYTENSFYLECLTLSLEEWVAQRVILALRVGQTLSVEPSTASFLLPVDLSGVEVLKAEVRRDDREIIALCVCDSEYVEVTLRGSWLSDGSEDAEGVFITTMSDRAEFFLHKLWQEAQACASVMSE